MNYNELFKCPKCGCSEIGSEGFVPTDLNPKAGYCELLAECVQDECNGVLKVLVHGTTTTNQTMICRRKELISKYGSYAQFRYRRNAQ